MRFITSASLGSQNISGSLLTATYTATAVDAITTRLFAAGVSGSANYLAFITLQRLGSGSTYQVIPVTSASVELGTTAIALTSIPVPVDNTDILKCYIQGSGSDTVSPSLWTYFYGENVGLSTSALGEIWADGVITAARISSSALTNAKFGAGAFGADTLGASALSGSNIATGALSVGKIGASAIAASNIGGSAFDSTVFKSNALGVGVLAASIIGASNIGGSAFDSTVFKTGALPVGVLGASVLAASNIGGSTFDSTLFKTGAIPVGVLGGSVIAASNIGGSAFDATVFKTDAIGATVLAACAITSDEFAQSAADKVWLSATRTLTTPATQLASLLAGSTLNVQRGDSFSLSLTGLGAITGFLELWFTVKDERSDADSAAKIMLTNGSRLKYINGAAPTASNNGLITVSSCTLGNVTFDIDATEVDDLVPDRGLYWDVQVRKSSGSISTLTGGTMNIIGDVTRSV